MKNNSTSRLFFLFISYFILALLVGAITAFLSQAGITLFSKCSALLFSPKPALLVKKILLPGFSFALACALICIGQFYSTLIMNRVLNDKVLVFAAMCMASFFAGHSFTRYTDSSMFALYSFRWLPCEICAFLAGIAALKETGPIFTAESDENINEEKEAYGENITAETESKASDSHKPDMTEKI